MKSDNEVPRAEDQKKAEELLSNVETFCHSADQGDSYIYESLVERIASALSALRASWEKEKADMTISLKTLEKFWLDVVRILGITQTTILENGRSPIEALEHLKSEKQALEERVKQAESLKDFTLSTNKELSIQFYAETLKRDKEINRLKEEIKCWEIDSGLTKALRENEEIARLKAENERLRSEAGYHGAKETVDVLSATIESQKEAIDTLTLALAEAHGALKPIADLNTSLEQDYVMGMAGVPDCDIISAREAIANKDGQRASEEMKRLREIEARMKGLEK